MKSIFGKVIFRGSSKKVGFEQLSEKEMSKVRGGTEPIKPRPRPADPWYDDTEW